MRVYVYMLAAALGAISIEACDDGANGSGSGTCLTDCRPRAIVEGGQVNPHGIAVANDNVYWGTEPQGGKPNLLRRVASTGGQVTDVTTDAGRFVLGSNGTSIFFVRTGALVRLDAGATAPTTIVAKLGGPSINSIAANTTHVYWANGEEIRRVAIGGGTPEVVYATPQVQAIVIDENTVYFTEHINNTLQGVAIDAPSPKTPRTLASQKDEMHFTVWKGTAYFASQRDLTIKSVPVTGGTPELLAETESGPLSIAADDSGIYFGSTQGLSRLPLTGGTPALVTAADTQSHMVLDITLDGANVYWIDYSYQALFRAGK
jgi:hypothetical protein